MTDLFEINYQLKIKIKKNQLKKAGLIEWKQNITIVIQLKEKQYKIFPQLLDNK